MHSEETLIAAQTRRLLRMEAILPHFFRAECYISLPNWYNPGHHGIRSASTDQFQLQRQAECAADDVSSGSVARVQNRSLRKNRQREILMRQPCGSPGNPIYECGSFECAPTQGFPNPSFDCILRHGNNLPFSLRASFVPFVFLVVNPLLPQRHKEHKDSQRKKEQLLAFYSIRTIMGVTQKPSIVKLSTAL